MSRKKLAMIFVIAKSRLFFTDSENPFSSELIRSATKIALRTAIPMHQIPTDVDEADCVNYIKSQRVGF